MSGAAPRPLVSVITPVFRAQATLPAALESIAASGLPPDRIEVVLAPDDGQRYDGLPDLGLRLVRSATHHISTGAGPARNRAIARARGSYIAFLDADDTWEPGYLTALLPLAEAQGAAFGRTRILLDRTPLLHLPEPDRQRLGFADLGRTGASFHPVLRRGLAGPFADLPSQDVLHTLEVLSLVGGAAPLAAVAYNLHLSPRSVTADRRFAERVAHGYTRHITDITAGRTRIRAAHIPAARTAFLAKARLNRAYMAAGKDRFFYQFMQDRLSR